MRARSTLLPFTSVSRHRRARIVGLRSRSQGQQQHGGAGWLLVGHGRQWWARWLGRLVQRHRWLVVGHRGIGLRHGRFVRWHRRFVFGYRGSSSGTGGTGGSSGSGGSGGSTGGSGGATGGTGGSAGSGGSSGGDARKPEAGGAEAGTGAVTFKKLFSDIFLPTCGGPTGRCHQVVRDNYFLFNMGDEMRSYMLLVPNAPANGTIPQRVMTLLGYVTPTTPGNLATVRMPPQSGANLGNPQIKRMPLTTEQIAQIRTWAMTGAKFE